MRLAPRRKILDQPLVVFKCIALYLLEAILLNTKLINKTTRPALVKFYSSLAKIVGLMKLISQTDDNREACVMYRIR